ncbi:MAG: DUF1638 domain-containing protein [Anaerolineaceae bacterium]|nr:DUF1638 domain-containing protein [Anaerolineaceae bacterium]
MLSATGWPRYNRITKASAAQDKGKAEVGKVTEMIQSSFADRCIISCGMLHPELTHLVQAGFLNPRRLLFTPPGLHALPEKLEEHLLERLAQARELCADHEIIVVYGKKCHVSTDEPLKRVDTILAEAGRGIVRVQGEYGYDMLAGLEERQEISGGRQDKILWFTPAWLKSWKTIFQKYFAWDEADANANFPGFYDKIIVLDSLGIADEYMEQHPEDILDLFDWTGLEVEFCPIALDRFRHLLTEALSPVGAGMAVRSS